MWGGPGPDPGGTKGGGTSAGPPSSQELTDLKDQFEQQQVLIAQLKEMLRKTEQTTVTQEKVEEYANTLTRMSVRAKKSKLKKESGDGKDGVVTITTTKTTTIDTPAKEKLMLLRQQVEENKQKLAERGKFQKGIEETVTQLKAQLDDSQQLISQTPLNLSYTDPRAENYTANSAPEELFNLVVTKDRRIAEQNVRIQKLEANVLDLQENVKEKDSVIDARTKAITLMSESLSKKGKNTLDELDDTKEQMRKMQQNFVVLEMEMKEEKHKLVIELEQKNTEIVSLQAANCTFEKTCAEQQSEIAQLNSSLEHYKIDLANYELKPVAEGDLHSQIEQLNSRIVELEGRNAELQAKPTDIAPRDSPQRSSKKGKKGQKLQKTKSKESGDDAETKLNDLQKMLDEAKAVCEQHLNKITDYELTVSELNITIDALKAKDEAQTKVADESADVAKLKKQLDEHNKGMIKIKAQHKSKLKELNKKIDELKKGGGGGEELSRLQAENGRLSERVDVLEEEKANLGLDTSCSSLSKDLGVTERVKELEIKLIEQSELVASKDQSIASLDEQIKSHKSEIETLTERFEKLSHLENAQVVSEITSIHFEEQLDQLEIEKQELLREKDDMIREKEALLEKLDALAKEKQEISNKLDSYMQENMELIDKLEKLSAEKVSSAESIEIVEGLTQQEKLELEAYQKSLEMTSDNIKNSDENLEQNPELNDSVNQLTEETSDLLRKIELFTEERREVMEKMEALNAENNQLNLKIHEIENNRDILAETYEQLQNDKEELENKVDQKQERIRTLETTLDQLRTENETLKVKIDNQQEIKQGSEVEETVKVETSVPLTSANKQHNIDLQTQIDEYKSLVQIQSQEIQELKLQLLSQKDLSQANHNLNEQITSLQSQYETLIAENDKLKAVVKANSELVHEKDAIESELVSARKRIGEFDEKLTNNLNEIENYKSIVEENKNELISSANIINDLQNNLQEKQNNISHYQNEISHLNSVIAELNNAVSHLESENRQHSDRDESMELMSNQLQELKALLNENLKQIEDYEEEMEQNSTTVASLNTQLKELGRHMLEMEHNLECKEDEIRKLTKERDNKEIMIDNLQSELKVKDENFHRTCETLKEKYLVLQSQIEENAGSLENIKDPASKIEQLENKNKEQLEKMKKIAANLKKKSLAYQELEAKYQQSNTERETNEKEKHELHKIVQMQETKLASLLEQLHELEKEFSAVQGALAAGTKDFATLAEDSTNLRIENEELREFKQRYEQQLNMFTTEAEMRRSDESNNLNVEINEKNEVIRNLNQELETTRYNAEINSNALYAKIQEMEMFGETQEAELSKYKEKINKLEEGLSTVEERRLSLEQKAMDLGAQLQEKSNSYEEISQTEDILEQRLAALIVHDEKIERHLQETVIENQEVIERNRFLVEENDQLKHRLSAATERNLDASTNQEKLDDLQNENLRLNDTIINLESDNKRSHVEYEKKLSEKKNEIEAMEVELQGQLEQLDGERKTLLVQCEHLRDRLKEYEEVQEAFKEEIEQHRQKLEQQQVDFDTHILEFQKVSDENKKNLGVIERKSLEQEDVARKVEELERVLAERDLQIENYQKLQMQEAFGQGRHVDVFGQVAADELQISKNQLVELERVNSELLEKVRVLEQQQNQANRIVEEPQKSAPEQTVSTFVWPAQDNDPFDFVIDPVVSKTQTQNVEPIMQQSIQTTVEAQTDSLPQTHLSENTKEELLNKIKTLEFMLYNTEQEKEDVLLQCLGLTNEIAQLIYERQNSAQLEAQVCSENETIFTSDERQQLKNVEFVHTKEFKDSPQSQPVVEEIIGATDAYLCYKPEAPHEPDNIPPRPQVLGHQAILEPQIVPVASASVTHQDLQQLHDVEFEKAKPCEPARDSTHPQLVVEDILVAKTAYLCHQMDDPPDDTQRVNASSLEPQIVSSEDARVTNEDLRRLRDAEFEKTKPVKAGLTKGQPVLEDVESNTRYLCYKPEKQAQEATTSQAIPNLEVFDENDDGWGCGLDEVRLEEIHWPQMNNPPPLNQNLNLRIEELDERVRALELERERHLEEIKQAQVKSGKLIKKLKEFKALNEKLRKSSDFGGLDDAIQDELQSQVARLEKKVKESGVELEKEKNDKINLLKKMEALQTTNDRLLETREKLDVDMLSLQRQNRELNAKLEQLEWGDDGFDSPKHVRSETPANPDSHLERKVQDLTDTIKELTLDNEELQVMLEEQRTLRINAEKAKSVEPIPENMKTEAEYLSIVTERNHLNEQLVLSVEEKKHLQEQLNHLIKNNGELQALVQEKSQLEVQIVQNNDITQELRMQLENLQRQNENLLQTSTAAQNEAFEQGRTKISILEQENAELNNSLQILNVENGLVSELKVSIATLNEEKAELFTALQEKNVQIESLKEVIAQDNQKKCELEEKLSQSQIVDDEKRGIAEKLRVKEVEFVEMSTKLDAALAESATLTTSIEQLADEWNQRVDQRGLDVAESWKLHLDSRETEFAQVEQQLRKEMNEFEEKCNALVNENNELRKNVDAEIRNEVDRISALQQQINDRQHYINDLTRVVQDNQAKIEQQETKLLEYENQTLQLKEQVQERDAKVAEAEAKIATLERVNKENSQVIEELIQKLNVYDTLQLQLDENRQTIADLQQNLNEKQNTVSECLQKLDKSGIDTDQYKDTCTILQQQMHEKDIYIAEIASKLQEIQMQGESDVKSVHTLQQQIVEINSQLQEKQMQIEAMHQEIYSYQQFTEGSQIKEDEIIQLKAEIAALLSDKETANVHLQEKHGAVEAYEAEIARLKLEMDHFRSLLSEKEREYAHSLAMTSQESESVFHEKAYELDILKRRQMEAENRYEELSLAKDSDMENLRLQLQEEEQRNEVLVVAYQEREGTLNEFKTQLDLKEQECEELHSRIFEQNALHNEENKQLIELREIIEDQVLKIESLKQELFEKSKDYDSLIAEMDIRKPSRSEPSTAGEERRVHFDTQVHTSDVSHVELSTPEEDELLEPVSRAELDLALYMLHQRDVRCEELTVELMQLLEERDTLQLKLSNSIREKEDLRNRFLPRTSTPESTDGATDAVQSPSTPTGAVPKSRASAILLGATGTELATEATERSQEGKDVDLANKLSELKSVGYGRDKTLLDEQQQRRLQQLSLMQQHRDVAAMLPAEAAARLVHDANYTLSRDVQSPSKVLLNWLWGRSTPKVNNV